MKTSLKKLCITIFLAGLFANPVLAEGVVENIEGFPLMPSFSEDESRALFFDKPEGRVIEGMVAGVANLSEVKAFYKESLAQIGWVMVAGGTDNLFRFNKEGETLSLEFKAHNNMVQVMVFLVPSSSIE